jgi:hypothetical protein
MFVEVVASAFLEPSQNFRQQLVSYNGILQIHFLYILKVNKNNFSESIYRCIYLQLLSDLLVKLRATHQYESVLWLQPRSLHLGLILLEVPIPKKMSCCSVSRPSGVQPNITMYNLSCFP